MRLLKCFLLIVFLGTMSYLAYAVTYPVCHGDTVVDCPDCDDGTVQCPTCDGNKTVNW